MCTQQALFSLAVRPQCAAAFELGEPLVPRAVASVKLKAAITSTMRQIQKEYKAGGTADCISADFSACRSARGGRIGHIFTSSGCPAVSPAAAVQRVSAQRRRPIQRGDGLVAAAASGQKQHR